jgi:hypothetical protein
MMQDWHNLIGRQPVNQEMKLLPPTVKIAIHLDRLLSSGIFHSTAGGRGQRRGAEPHVVSRRPRPSWARTGLANHPKVSVPKRPSLGSRQKVVRSRWLRAGYGWSWS